MAERVSDERLKKLKECSLLLLARRVAAGGNVLRGGFPDGVKPFQQVLIDVFDDLVDARLVIAGQREHIGQLQDMIDEKDTEMAQLEAQLTGCGNTLVSLDSRNEALREKLAAAEAKIFNVRLLIKQNEDDFYRSVSCAELEEALADTEAHNGE